MMLSRFIFPFTKPIRNYSAFASQRLPQMSALLFSS